MVSRRRTRNAVLATALTCVPLISGLARASSCNKDVVAPIQMAAGQVCWTYRGAFGARVKAGAGAPPLARLTALTGASDADFVPPCNRCRAVNSGMGFQLLLPRFAVAQHGVEDGEQFSRHGDQRDHFLFSGGDEALVEGLEGAIVLHGDQGPHEERAAHAGASAADEALAFPLAGLARPRGEAGERSDLATVERAEFRHLGQQPAGDRRSDARHALHEAVLLAPQRRGLDRLADLPVEVGELLL